VTALIENGLMNAPVALCLAGIVLLIGRFWKQPALLHALWVLVLVKLLMPPLIEVPVSWQLPAWMNLSQWSGHAEVAAAPQAVTIYSGATYSAATSTSMPDSSSANRGNALHMLEDRPRSFTNQSARLSATTASGSILAVASGVSPEAQADQLSRDTSSRLPGPDGLFGQVLVSEIARAMPFLFIMCLIIWGVGSVIWFCSEGWRIVRFAQVFLRYASRAPRPMQRHASNLAREMGIKHCPEVWLLSAVVSPMLWCVGGRARILFPSELATQLDKGAMATLLTHELAHYYRGDHWVRMLEFVVTGLFWWHPAVWIARREIEIHEEQCCDSWVVGQFPKAPRRYADALLATIDFLSDDHSVMPAAASGLGNAPLIRQRLILIMRGVAPKNLGLMGRITVCVMALLIPIQPRLSVKTASIELPTIQESIPSHPGPYRLHPHSERDLESSRIQHLGKATPNPDAHLHLPKPKVRQRSATPVITRSIPEINAKTVSTAEPSQCDDNSVVWGKATAPNSLSQIVAYDDGDVLWEHFCTDDAADLSQFEISTVAYTPEGQLFVAGCRDGKIRVWDASNGQLLKTLAGHKSDIRAVAVSPRGDWLVSGDQKGEVRVWSVLDERFSEILSNYCAPISSVAFSKDGKTIAVATSVCYDAHRTSLQMAPSSNSHGGGSGLVAFWNLLERAEIRHIATRSPLAAIAFSMDSSVLSGAEWSGRVFTWNVRSTQLVATRIIDRKVIAASAFSVDAGSIHPKFGPSF
jgi:bla regulator protein BlaR1